MIPVDDHVAISRRVVGIRFVERVHFAPVCRGKLLRRHAAGPICIVIAVRDDNGRLRHIELLADDRNKQFCLFLDAVLRLIAAEKQRVNAVGGKLLCHLQRVAQLVVAALKADMAVGHIRKGKYDVAFVKQFLRRSGRLRRNGAAGKTYGKTAGRCRRKNRIFHS